MTILGVFVVTGLMLAHLGFLVWDEHAAYSLHGKIRNGTLIVTRTPLDGIKCQNGEEPHIKYVTVMDAGSSGTRIHVYEFAYCQQIEAVGDRKQTLVPILVGELFFGIKPGLSHFLHQPRLAGKSLRPLLAMARRTIPKAAHVHSPLFVKATAGLRLMAQTKGTLESNSDQVKSYKQTAILASVRRYLALHRVIHKGAFPSNSHKQHLEQNKYTNSCDVTVMDGIEEALMGWITVNYLHQRLSFQHISEHLSPKNRVRATDDKEEPVQEHLQTHHHNSLLAMVELGGASFQVVFAIGHFEEDDEDLAVGNTTNLLAPDPQTSHSYYTRLGKYVLLYQHSYLGYGMTEALKRLKETACQSPAINDGVVTFECFPQGHSEYVSCSGCTLIGSGVSWDGCVARVQEIFDKDIPCPFPPCSFNGVHQPPLPETAEIVAFSYLHDVLAPLGIARTSDTSKNNPSLKNLTFSVADVEAAGRSLCSSGQSMNPLLAENGHLCLEVAYVYVLLTSGLGLSLQHRLQLAQDIGGFQASWCLGTALQMLAVEEETV